MKAFIKMVGVLALCGLTHAAQAREYVIGQVAELSGLGSATENSAGAQLWFDHINKKGPHQFVVRALDDKRDAKQTVELTRQLVKEHNPIALFGYRGTSSLEAIAPVLSELEVPLVGPFNGSDTVRERGRDWMFFLRATYREEAEKLVAHLQTRGVTSVAIVHQEDSFGKETTASFVATLEKAGLKPVAIYTYDRKTLDTSAAVKGLKETRPQAVLMACTAKACANVINGVREFNTNMILMALSNAVNDDLLQGIAKQGRGVILSQVMPFPFNNNREIVKEFSRLNGAPPKVPVTPSALEGFAAAKLLTTAILKAGPTADAKGVAEVLRSTSPIDLGGLFYDPKAKTRYVELMMVSREGRLIR